MSQGMRMSTIFFYLIQYIVLSDGDLLNNSLHVRTGRFLECDITMVKYLLSKYELVIPLKLQRIKNKIGLQQW